MGQSFNDLDLDAALGKDPTVNAVLLFFLLEMFEQCGGTKDGLSWYICLKNYCPQWVALIVSGKAVRNLSGARP